MGEPRVRVYRVSLETDRIAESNFKLSQNCVVCLWEGEVIQFSHGFLDAAIFGEVLRNDLDWSRMVLLILWAGVHTKFSVRELDAAEIRERLEQAPVSPNCDRPTCEACSKIRAMYVASGLAVPPTETSKMNKNAPNCADAEAGSWQKPRLN